MMFPMPLLARSRRIVSLPIGPSGTDTASFPSGWQPGDVFVTFASERGGSTVPTVPAGWTILQTQGAASPSGVLAWREMQSGDTEGTWTNANIVYTLGFRNAIGIGGSGMSYEVGTTTVTYPSLTMQYTKGRSLITIGFLNAGPNNPSWATDGPSGWEEVYDAPRALVGQKTRQTSYSAPTGSGGGGASGHTSFAFEVLGK